LKLLRAFKNAPSGLLGVGVLALLLLVAVVAPSLFGTSADQIDFVSANRTSSLSHIFGTDRLGRDILLRLLVATRLSIGLALGAIALAVLIGVPLGGGMTLLRGRARSFGLRTIDTMIAFPALIVAIYIGAIIGPGALGAVLGVGIAYSFGIARIVSTLALSVGGRDYISAARVIGANRWRLLSRYILPNIAEVLVIGISVSLANALIAIAGLSFLGLGIQAPAFDWGRMLTEGVQAFYANPAAAIGPALFVATAALAFGFAGEALARAMNPLLWASAASTVHEALPGTLGLPMQRVVRALKSTNGAKSIERVDDLVLDVRDLRVVFPGKSHDVEIVKGVSFSVRRSEILGIVGESGCGKTMTALAIAQLVPHPGRVEGIVELAGKDLVSMPRDKVGRVLGTSTAMVFQDPMTSMNPALTIGVQLTEGAERHRHLDHKTSTLEAIGRLAEVRLPTPRVQLQRHPHQLSGGMRQRVMIAMGLMNNPQLLIADEPTTALDVTIQAQIMDLLHEVNEKHKTAVILISHNLGLIKQNCDRVIVMYGGQVVEELPSERLTIDPLHPYTQGLLAAVPDVSHRRGQPLAYIPGQAPDPADPPTGCPYHPRCPLAMDICRQEMPPLASHAGGRRVACWAVEAAHR
jgi:oligopeptide/dipeptide ABC transporter ATP-binding protein